MKRLSHTKELAGRDQRGINVVDAIFAMMIASMIAATVMTALQSWYTTRSLNASQDAATQHAQEIIARADVLAWDKLGFLDPDDVAEGEDAPPAFCDSAFISNNANPASTDTVTLEAGELDADYAPNLYPKSGFEIDGQEYCVLTDISWAETGHTYDADKASEYHPKNVTVNVLWKSREGTPRSIAVNSLRTPNVGESVPGNVTGGQEAETSPLNSFMITAAGRAEDTAAPEICFTADWDASAIEGSEEVKLVNSSSPSFYPYEEIATLSEPAVDEKCIEVPEITSGPYYGVVVADGADTTGTNEDGEEVEYAASVKFRSGSDYQFPGNKLTAEGPVLDWTTYPTGEGGTKYEVYASSTSDFSSPILLETTDTAYFEAAEAIGNGYKWFQVVAVSDDYTIDAYSNIVQIEEPEAP